MRPLPGVSAPLRPPATIFQPSGLVGILQCSLIGERRAEAQPPMKDCDPEPASGPPTTEWPAVVGSHDRVAIFGCIVRPSVTMLTPPQPKLYDPTRHPPESERDGRMKQAINKRRNRGWQTEKGRSIEAGNRRVWVVHGEKPRPQQNRHESRSPPQETRHQSRCIERPVEPGEARWRERPQKPIGFFVLLTTSAVLRAGDAPSHYAPEVHTCQRSAAAVRASRR